MAEPANPNALTVEQAAKLLQVDVETIRGHLDEGLPAGPGEAINLVTYAAWLIRKIG